MNTPMSRRVAVAVLAVAGFSLAACGGDSSSPAASASPSGAGATASSSPSALPSSSASVAAFSCAIKPGAGLLPSQTAKPGRIVATIAEIESATGLPMNRSVDITMIGGMTQCRYEVGQGGQLDITILNDPGKAGAELASTKSKSLSLHDRGCNGCTLSKITPASELGPSGYRGDNSNGPVFGSISGGVYFEVEGFALKDARVERVALVIAANLSGTTPSLPPLPTATPAA
jgi:hypothetical protein